MDHHISAWFQDGNTVNVSPETKALRCCALSSFPWRNRRVFRHVYHPIVHRAWHSCPCMDGGRMDRSEKGVQQLSQGASRNGGACGDSKGKSRVRSSIEENGSRAHGYGANVNEIRNLTTASRATCGAGAPHVASSGVLATRGNNMDEYIKIARPANPSCILPENLDTPVWRYMDLDKFQSLLNEKALYLCRADRLQDRFEGTYSRHQIIEMEKWFKDVDESHMIESERERRRKDLLRTYISCWCMGEFDLDLMWKGYVRNPPGISVKSTARRLKNICDKAVGCWPLDISTVTYFDHAGAKNINYFGTPTNFLYKDVHFKLDNELRIVHTPNFSEPMPTHVYLKIDLEDLIEEVVFQPGVEEMSLMSVRKALNDVGLDNVPLLASRDDRDLIE